MREYLSAYTIRVTGDGSGPGYLIQVDELPGCVAAARTLAEVDIAIAVAIAVYLDEHALTVTPQGEPRPKRDKR